MPGRAAWRRSSCICRRMGGGFGGKETQAAVPAMLAALVAAKTGRPARFVFGTTGHAHHRQAAPVSGPLRSGFDDDGLITRLKADFFSNGGFSADLSLAVMERTLLHADNAYFIPNVEFTGTVCRTNFPSNTAFRGFGGPQAVAAIENIIEEIAAHLGRRCARGPPAQLLRHRRRQRHAVRPGRREQHAAALFDRLAETSRLRRRRAEIAEFNAASQTHLRGLR